LLLLKRALEHWWVDVAVAAPLLQRSTLETEAAIEELAHGTTNGQPVIEGIAGTPADAPRAWRISEAFLAALQRWDDRSGVRRRSPQRRDVALDYARARGRISTTELASIVKALPPNVGAVLKGLEQEGLLTPGRENRRGPGFFYVPVR
jgi:ATP-dependent DNA helicase RecG